ncbi:hypothetical protein [Flavobacterium sp. HJJ]|uniref:hypothetical protein n=1 Tax=Flavobacterium sp. HJJ TaxID=2783792 RepID=UPI00188B419B|nr:hypothetical protein [Flavobacterium sp. HJJ]MBF4470929.1 hypothetical protein [Flavobacterium sp. HJJ]
MKKIKKPKEKEKTEQSVTEKAKQEKLDKSDKKLFIQIDKSGDPISNFISNFIRQFKNPTSLGLPKLSEWLSLFTTKRIPEEKEHTKPSDIMGSVKTVFSSEKKISTEGGKNNEGKTISQGVRHTNFNKVKEKQDFQTQRKTENTKPKLRM